MAIKGRKSADKVCQEHRNTNQKNADTQSKKKLRPHCASVRDSVPINSAEQSIRTNEKEKFKMPNYLLRQPVHYFNLHCNLHMTPRWDIRLVKIYLNEENHKEMQSRCSTHTYKKEVKNKEEEDFTRQIKQIDLLILSSHTFFWNIGLI